MKVFAAFQIEDFDCFVHLGGDKQPMTTKIDRRVIEITGKTGQQSCVQKLQWSIGLRTSRDRE
jgi:hypothetical protein